MATSRHTLRRCTRVLTASIVLGASSFALTFAGGPLLGARRSLSRPTLQASRSEGQQHRAHEWQQDWDRLGGFLLSMAAAFALTVLPVAQAQALAPPPEKSKSALTKGGAIGASKPTAPTANPFSETMAKKPPATALKSGPSTAASKQAPAAANPFAATMAARPPASALKSSPGLSSSVPSAPASNPFAATMAKKPPSAASAAGSTTTPNPFAATMAAKPPTAGAGTSGAPVGSPVAIPSTAAPSTAPKAAAPAPAQAPQAPPPVVNEKVIVNEKIVYAQPEPAAPVTYAPSYGGVVAAPPPQPGLSLGEAAVAVGATMAIKGIMDVVAPSPEKVMENQMKEDERKLDEQQRQLEALKKDLAAATAASK